MSETLNVRNARQAVLFELELKGQISDGKWENTANTDWRTWCGAEVVVNPEAIGRNFWAQKDNFSLTAKDLLSCVGGRMLVYARLADEGFTIEEIRKIDSNFLGLDGDFWEEVTHQGKYWDDRRADRAAMLEANPQLEMVIRHACSDDTGYEMKDLYLDLKDLKTCFKTRR
tara:strand:- start:2860 stop:3372 length:513 start_codon:yes stop_codon:yes gene_type:complete